MAPKAATAGAKRKRSVSTKSRKTDLSDEKKSTRGRGRKRSVDTAAIATAGAAASGDDPDCGFVRMRMGGKRWYSYDGHRCVGIHRFLQEHFWDESALASSSIPADVGELLLTETGEAVPTARTATASSSSSKRGPEGNEGKRPWMDALQAACARGKCTDEQITWWVYKGTLPKDANGYAKSLVAAYGEAGLLPVRAQCVVGIGEARVATELDVLMKDALGHMYVIENKTCNDKPTFEDAGSQWMKGVLSDVPCTRLNAAKLQAAVTRWMAEECYGCTISRAYVARADRSGCDLYETDDAWVTRGVNEVKRIIGELRAHYRSGPPKKKRKSKV